MTGLFDRLISVDAVKKYKTAAQAYQLGPDTLGLAANIIAKIVLVGLTWAFFQHMLSGLRHFVLDMGAGYELKTNRFWSIASPLIAMDDPFDENGIREDELKI